MAGYSSPLPERSSGPADDDELQTVNLVRNLFNASRNFRSKRMEWWRRAYQLVHNRAWNPARDAWMPTPSASEIMPIVAALVAWMTDQRPMLYVNPSAEPGSEFYPISSKLGNDLEKVLEANWRFNRTAAEHEKMLWDALLYGTGILKTGWDQSLQEGLGDARTVRVDPFAFYPDPQASKIEDANYLIEATTMSVQELDRRYPGAARMIKGAAEETGGVDERPDMYAVGRPPMANPGGISGAAPRYGMPGGDPGRATVGRWYDQGITVYECWIRENDEWTDEEGEIRVDDQWRVVVCSGNRVLLDEPATELFGHGRHPYTRYVTAETGEFWGISLVEHLAPLQIHLNRLLAAMQQNAELTGNPVFMEDSRSGIQRSKITNRPGVRLTKAPGSEADWLTAPSMPAQVMQMVQFYIGEMERVSGLSAIVRGATPTGRNSQGVLDSVQEAAFVRVRMALRNMERALAESGELAAHLCAENYTESRIVSISGQQDSTPLVLRARHFYVPGATGDAMPLKFSLAIQAGASLPTSRQARAQEADTLYAMGGVDREALLDAHDYPNRAAVIQRIQKQIEAGIWSPPGARARAGRKS